MHGDPDAGWIAGSRDGVSGEATEHRDAATATRQQHHAGGPGLGVKRFGQEIAVKFRGDVEIVHAVAHAGSHQDSGGAGERSRTVEENPDAVQRLVDHGRVVEREDPIFHAEAGGERNHRRLVASCEDQRRARCCGALRRHAAGVARRTIDHQFFHVGAAFQISKFEALAVLIASLGRYRWPDVLSDDDRTAASRALTCSSSKLACFYFPIAWRDSPC